MSVEEDTELRDLISQTLEANGCFSKIRAQLRASIYLALDEDEMFQKRELLPNKKVHSVLDTVEGKIMFCIVREFLEQFDLDFTISVFDSESYMGSNYQYMGRYKLIEDLNIPSLEQESPDPVLLQLIQLCKFDNKSFDSHDTNSVSSINCKNDLVTQNDYTESNSAVSVINDSELSKRASSDSELGNVLSDTFENQDVQAHDNSINNGCSSHIYDGNSTFTLHKATEDTIDISKLNLEETSKEIPLIDFDKSLKVDNTDNKSDSEKTRSLLDQTIVDFDFSPPVLKDSKQSKLPSAKSDKVKMKNNLSSLSDLPPLPMTKTRANDMLLPSLYTKDFKDKSNVKDIDKLFELEPLDNYEEDFISESEIDLTIKKQEEMLKNNTLKVLKMGEISDGMISDATINPTSCVDLFDRKTLNLENSSSSSLTSEGFDLNSNVDDILNSC